MKCKKLFLVSIFLLAVISLGVVCAEDNQALDDSTALRYAHDDMGSDIEPFGENQKGNVENPKNMGGEALLKSSFEEFDCDSILNIKNNSAEDVLNGADLNQEVLKGSDEDLPKIYIPGEIIYYASYEEEIMVTYPEGVNGNVVVLLDGEYYATVDLKDYTASFGTETEDGTVIYEKHTVNIPLNIDELTFKSYNVTVIYNGDNVEHEISQSKMCKLSYIGLANDFLIYKESLITFSAPPSIKSNKFTIILDGKKYDGDLKRFSDEYGCTYYAIDDLYLPIGYHSISIKYPGDDIYPELEYDAIIDVEKSPYSKFVLGQNATIFYIHTPEWGEKFLVSIELENEDNTTPILTKYVSLVDGKASCTLSGLDLGRYVANVYNAEDNDLIFKDYFSIVPLKVSVPEKIYIDNPGRVSAVLPADAIGNMSVKIIYSDEDDNLKQYKNVTVPFKNGVAVVDLPKLFASDTFILDVYFTTENYGNYTDTYDYYFDEIIDENDNGNPNYEMDDDSYRDNNRIIHKLNSRNNVLKSTNNPNSYANIISYLETKLQSLTNEPAPHTINNTSKKSENTTIQNNGSSKAINGVEANQNTLIIAIFLLICVALVLLLVRKFKS